MKYPLALLPLLAGSLAYAAGDVELGTVEVTAPTNPFAALTNDKLSGQANLKVLGNQNTFSAPINVVSYSEKIIEDQQSRTTTDLLGKNDASVTSMGGEGYILHGIQVRGFRIDTREFSLNGLPGIFAGFQSSTAYIGSLDLIKGASGGLGGMSPESAVGASVNVQSKKAGDKDLNRIGLGWFSDTRWQTTADISRRFGERKEWGVRFNAQYRNGQTARDFQDEENSSFALNADYRGEHLQGQIDIIHNNRNNSASRIRIDGVHSLNFSLPEAPDGKTNLAQPWTWQDGSETIVALTGKYKLTDRITVSAGLGHNETKSPQAYQSINLINNLGDFRESAVSLVNRTIDTTSANIGLRGYHLTGGVSHDWAASFDYTDRDRGTAQSSRRIAYPYAGRRNNIYSMTYFPSPDLSSGYNNPGVNTNRSQSLGVTDTLGFLDDTLRFTLGARFQKIESFNTSAAGVQGKRYREDALNPLLAVAWQPKEDFIVYANYMRDLEPGGIVDDPNAVNDGEILPPYETRQYEFGVRKGWGNVTTTAAFFQIDNPSVYLDSQTRSYGVNGKTRFRGIEMNAYASFLNNSLRPGFGFTLMEGKLHSQDNPALNGNQTVGTPKLITKASLEWDTPWIRGLTLKGNMQHYGDSYQDPANRYKVSGYTLFDIGARYSTRLAGKDFSVNASIENLFNKHYWQTFIGGGSGSSTRSIALVGMPRTMWVNAKIDF